MMFACPHCGTGHTSGARYCPKCGKQLAISGGADEMVTQKALNLFDVQYRLGLVYFRKGQYARAVEVWEKLLRIRPDDADLKALVEDARSKQEASGAGL